MADYVVEEQLYDGRSIVCNGLHLFTFPGPEGKRDFMARWDAKGVAPAGTLTLLYDGNPGIVRGVLDLAAGENAARANMRLDCIEVDVQGLPAGGAVFFSCR